ncbi:MAG TPA: exodeoxyribonuclease V subunit gamma [Kofleriaceae bacterium]
MALRAVHGNRVEALLDALLDALPAADPFAPSQVVVGSHLVSRWLTREIALRRGIAAGLELVTFDAFLEATWAGDDHARAAQLTALDRSQLAAAIASVLADDRIVGKLPAVAAYLAAAPAPGDRAGPRRVQLAEHVATLAWNYALSRPDWMPALVEGRVPSELANEEAAGPAGAAADTARWQAVLIGEAMQRAGCDGKRCIPVPTLPWARRRLGLPPPRIERALAMFGVSFLSRAQLEALTDLASANDVTVYLLDPCAELWDDVSGRARAEAAIDPLPLTLWGRAVRDTLGALVERTGGDLQAAFIESEPRDAREQLMHDVLHRRAPSATSANPSTSLGVRVLACPDPRREIEIVAAEIRAQLDADPSLYARDVGVWIASNDERYLAQAPAAFEAVGVPWHLIDAPLDDRGRIGEAMLALLELPTSAMTRPELLRVMTHPAVLAGHPHVNAEDWVKWTEKLGIVHGADAQAHQDTYLEDHPGRFHWDQGVRRLALGAFMIGGALGSERGPVRIANLDVAPEEVRPEQHASAATFALLVRSLCADSAWLATHEATLTEWANLFVGLVDAYLGRPTDEAARDVERVRAMLAGIAHIDLDGRRVGFREAREHAVQRLASARSNRGEPLAAGVMVAPLAAMRALPFRVTFVVGLDEGSFPAGDQPSPLDVRRESRAGDVSPRDRDRHAFLEVLLGARDALYLSYVAVEAKSGQALGPSSAILELADALAPYLGAPSSKHALDQITTRFPLHRFNADAALPPAIVRERWALRVRDALRAHLRANGHPVPDEDGMLALLEHDRLAELRGALGIVAAPVTLPPAPPVRPLSIANLRAFLEAPVQAWAQAVLGLDELPDDAVIEHSDEPFVVDRPLRAVLLREVLAAQLRDPSADAGERYQAVVRDLELRGQFPVGVFGSAARANDLRVLAEWRDKLAELGMLPRHQLHVVGSAPAAGAPLATRLGFGRSSSPIAELMPALEIPLGAGRTVRLVGQTEILLRTGDRHTSVIPLLGKADRRSRYHLRGALDHLVLAAAGLANHGHVHVLLDPEGTTRKVEHAPWSRDEAQHYLASLIGELLDQPHGYLLPFSHLVDGLNGKKPSRQYGDTTPVLGYGPITRLDGLAAPPQPGEIAERRLAPLVERMTGDHSLGGDS